MRRKPTRRRGVVLIIVLVVVIVLALAAYTFSDLMLAHRRVAVVSGQRLQTRMLVYSGMEAVKVYLMQDEATREEAGGHFNNPAFFQANVVLPESDPNFRGTFTVLAPFIDEEGLSLGGVRYGLEDESSRLNMNLLMLADEVQPNAGRDLLLALPGMTEDVADAILDWLDEDEEARDYGAEFAEYYSSLSPAYEPRNGPLQSVEELLLVRGVTPELLFGLDFNRNGMVDPHERQMASSLGVAGAGAGGASGADAGLLGMPERGWSSYLTLYSSERNISSSGLPRIFLNSEDLETLQDELSEIFSDEQVNFILAYRLYGPDEQTTDGTAETTSNTVDADELELDLTAQPQAEIGQVLDLIGARVRIQEASEGGQDGQPAGGTDLGTGGRVRGSSDGTTFVNWQQPGGRAGQNSGEEAAVPEVVESPFTSELLAMASYLPTLMDNCTVVEADTIPGRININEAQREILLGIPAVSAETGESIITEELVDEILDLRAMSTDTGADHTHETWLLSEAVVSLEDMKALMPFICAGGDVYRCQIVGYYQGGGPSTRAEVVFDATGDSPSVLFWRDISHLGRGHALEVLGVDLIEPAGL